MPARFDPEFLKAEIAQLRTLLPELDDDDQLRLDMIQGSTNIDDVMNQLLDLRQETSEQIAGIKIRRELITLRKERLEFRNERITELMRSIMQAADLKKLPLPEATLSIVAGRSSVGIEDVEQLPQGYVKVVKTADKAAISAAFKNGETIPGAYEIIGDPTLQVRTK
jgi:chorismate mutase